MTANELICDDCLEGDHDECRRQGGWPYQDTNEKCGCHETSHALDNRPRCHCCHAVIIGCSGALAWPGGHPFEDPPEFHCPRCAERHLRAGVPCHVRRTA